jgi:hypothetical protein
MGIVLQHRWIRTASIELVDEEHRAASQASALRLKPHPIVTIARDIRIVSWTWHVVQHVLNLDGVGQIVIEPNRAAAGVGGLCLSPTRCASIGRPVDANVQPYQSLRVGQPVRVTSDQDVTAEITLLRALHTAHHQPVTQQPMPPQPQMAPRQPWRSGERG